MRNTAWRWGGGIVAIVVALVLFIVPFLFIIFTAGKSQAEASALEFSWPTEWVFFDNIATVLQNRDFLLVRAFINSTLLTVVAVAVMVVLGAMVGYVLQRRKRDGTRSSTASCSPGSSSRRRSFRRSG